MTAPEKTAGNEAGDLVPLVYDELRKMARRLLRRPGRRAILEPTALVHDALIRLIGHPEKEWMGRTHFLAAGATTMRRLLMDEARSARREKRGPDWHRVSFSNVDARLFPQPLGAEELLALDQALERLKALDERQATVVELRFFGGLDIAEITETLGVSRRTVEAAWTHARAWLRRELSGAER